MAILSRAYQLACVAVDAVTPGYRFGCKCRFHEGCDIHHSDGRLLADLTAADLRELNTVEFKPAPADEEWHCYCGRHDDERGNTDPVPAGTLCFWEKTSYEYDEYECCCIDKVRDDFIMGQSNYWLWAGRRDSHRYSTLCKIKRLERRLAARFSFLRSSSR